MFFRPISKLALILLLGVSPAPRAEAAGNTFSGLTVEQAIGMLSEGGLRIYFSSDLIRSFMTVEHEPDAQSPTAQLVQMLAPYGLTLRPGLNGSWLVVRKPEDKSMRPGSTAPASSNSADTVLSDAISPPEEVVVSASRYEVQGSNTSSLQMLTDVDLRYAADLGDDAIRSISRLPGMASNGYSSLANVRGGEIRETLVRLDGLRLYEPYHLRDFQGVFSVIDPRVVSTMDVYTGGFPARFGNGMSGVIDVETISAPDSLHHEFGLSFFNTSILSAGTFLDDRAEWVASARRSNLDILYDRFSEQPERPRYTDVIAKLKFDSGQRHSFAASLLRATDDIALADDADREERASARQTDNYLWVRADHRLGGRTSGSTLLASTHISSERAGQTDKAGVSAGALTDVRYFSMTSIQSEWTRVIASRLLLDFGGSVSRAIGRYDYADEVEFDLLFDFDGAPTTQSRSRSLQARPIERQYSLFSTLRVDVNRRLAVETGLRWTAHEIAGVSAKLVEPRFGVRYAVSDSTIIRANWGRFHQPQGINELQINDGVTRFYSPQRADHFIVGLDKRLENETTLRIEAYSKDISDLRPRFENLLNTRVLLPELKPDRIRISPEGAKAHGVEFSLDGQVDALHWWGSIGWAEVRDEFATGAVLRSWDQTYTFNAGMLLNLSRWSLSAGLVYRSGWPTTPVVLDESATLPTAVVLQRNSQRVSSYGSLDVRLSRTFAFEQSEVDVFFELVNITGRSNTCCVEYEFGDEDEAGLLVLDYLNDLPTIPSVGFNWIF